MPTYQLILLILGVMTAIAGTVVITILVLPEKKRPKLNKFFGMISDVANFKTLFIDKLMKILYVFATLVCVCVGFFKLFSFTFGGLINGFGLMLLGPVIVRVVFELVMLFILLTNNTIQINNKIKGQNAEADVPDEKANEPAPAEEPAPEPEPEPDYAFCVHCGTKYDKNKGGCTNPDCPAKK